MKEKAQPDQGFCSKTLMQCIEMNVCCTSLPVKKTTPTSPPPPPPPPSSPTSPPPPTNDHDPEKVENSELGEDWDQRDVTSTLTRLANKKHSPGLDDHCNRPKKQQQWGKGVSFGERKSPVIMFLGLPVFYIIFLIRDDRKLRFG